ncbi:MULTISPECIES: hypothetical protein [Serratia]|uniref:hypothetical protein n=1 Tax=Serratia TaxID=613 RepID=UPI001376CE35|nr:MULTISPECIES: hypothetical protein [Serratia]MBH3207556.1 hypothetical protein [Serratia marcescens]MDQ7766965.1 hypothetical protein [Serratia nevei]NCI54413.1 hypothetical protein [Serratia marcescens]NDJ05686.1 hypothetical protein [Serratia marcescens]NDJ29968.1 hypothetical protein [Serratia marcescens]
MSKLTKIFVTKYALSAGPFSVMAEIKDEGSMASWKGPGYWNYAHGKEFWLTEEEALADCQRRREAKLASIDKQAKKLQAMTFTIKELADGQ